MSIFDQHLDQSDANFVPLSPVSFGERSAEAFGGLPAVVHGARRRTRAKVRNRSARLAAALHAIGIGRLDTVSAMLPNTPEMVEAHCALPAGAYLDAVGNAVTWTLPNFPRSLWTLPIFRCNGWCFPWTVAMLGGTQVCLRRVEARAILEAMRAHAVDHYCAAPILHNLLLAAPAEQRQGIAQKVCGMVAGAAPPAPMIEGMARIDFDITHVYGLTEVYGPAGVAVKRASWAGECLSDQTRVNGRQGVRYPLQERMTVLDPDTMAPTPADGQTMGEIMFRGNVAMKGCLKNPGATAQAFVGGWFHTGDLAVMEPDRYVKIKDRSKDIIISGGENISSLEVEDALYRRPAVLACAVVAKPYAKWGETPVAFVELQPGASADAAEIVAHCKRLLAGYKLPREVRFEATPKTSTGKIQKFALRERAAEPAPNKEPKP